VTFMATETSFFDNEIAQLEKERGEVETELAQLTAGHISLTVGTQVIEMELGSVPLEADEEALKKHLALALAENPLAQTLTRGFMTEQELRDELEMPAPKGGLIMQNRRLNHKLSRKNQLLGSMVASPLLFLFGLLLLIYWGYVTFNKPPSSILPATPTSSPRYTPTPFPQARWDGVGKHNVSYILAREDEEFVSPTPSPLPDNTVTSTPTLTNFEGRVGVAPNQAGGLNGPHGSFLPPHRLQIGALSLNLLVQRATTQESDGTLSIIWAKPGELVHLSSYPGELGNMILLATQSKNV
jgi:hypothetical protein